MSTGQLWTEIASCAPRQFVGISAENFLASGDWPDETAFELFPYDAGTDNGRVYGSRNNDSNPQDPIRRITGFPLAAGGTVAPLGTFTFTRLAIVAVQR